MPKITDISLFYQNEQPCIAVRETTSVAKLPQIIQESFGLLMQYMEQTGELLAGMPYVCYNNMDMENLDVEIGFPVSKKLPDDGSVQASSISAGKQVKCMYLGPYEAMEPLYHEMAAWIDKNGLKPSGKVYELYYNGPECAPDLLLTEVIMPID